VYKCKVTVKYKGCLWDVKEMALIHVLKKPGTSRFASGFAGQDAKSQRHREERLKPVGC